MEQYYFSCFACGYSVETSGPYKFFVDSNNLRQPYPTPPPKLADGRERGFDGLYAQMYCTLCDEPTTAVVSQFYAPVTQAQLDAGEADPMPVSDPACGSCGNKRLLYAEGHIDCPRCPDGQLMLPSDTSNPLWQSDNQDSQATDFLSQKSEAKKSLRLYLLIAWIPLSLLAILFSLSAAGGAISACNKPGPDLRGFCLGPWQWLSLLVSLGPAFFMMLGGYFIFRRQSERLWPLLLFILATFLTAFLSTVR